MQPAKVKLTIYQGATFRKRFTWKTAGDAPINLTGCTARMQVRPDTSSPFVLLDLTSGNGRITLGGAAGTIDLHLTAVETAALAWDGGVYDLEIEDASGGVTRLLSGSVKVSPEVTRA